MDKFGSTHPFVFSVLGQIFMHPLFGFKVDLEPPKSDTIESSTVTFYISADEKYEYGKIEPAVKEALHAAARITNALIRGVPIIEHLPVQEDEEAKFTVTIRKSK